MPNMENNIGVWVNCSNQPEHSPLSINHFMKRDFLGISPITWFEIGIPHPAMND